MASDTEEILCGTCRVPLEGPANPEPQDRYTCPRCGNGDTVENVLAEVNAFVQEAAQGALDKSLRDALRGNDFIKVTGKPIQRRQYRFVTNHRFGLR